MLLLQQKRVLLSAIKILTSESVLPRLRRSCSACQPSLAETPSAHPIRWTECQKSDRLARHWRDQGPHESVYLPNCQQLSTIFVTHSLRHSASVSRCGWGFAREWTL